MKHENRRFAFAYLARWKQRMAISHNTEARSQDDLQFRQWLHALPSVKRKTFSVGVFRFLPLQAQFSPSARESEHESAILPDVMPIDS